MAFLALTNIIGLEGMHFGHFWPPRTPGGCQGGYGGFRGGPWDQKLQLFWEPYLGSKLWNFGLYELKTFYFPGFWLKTAPQEAKNGRFGLFLAKIGYAEKWIFLKNIISKFDKIAQKIPFGVNNELRKIWATLFIENFSGCQNWDSWSWSHANWDKGSYGPYFAMKGLKWP